MVMHFATGPPNELKTLVNTVEVMFSETTLCLFLFYCFSVPQRDAPLGAPQSAFVWGPNRGPGPRGRRQIRRRQSLRPFPPLLLCTSG